jgi:hypothetical protein
LHSNKTCVLPIYQITVSKGKQQNNQGIFVSIELMGGIRDCPASTGPVIIPSPTATAFRRKARQDQQQQKSGSKKLSKQSKKDHIAKTRGKHSQEREAKTKQANAVVSMLPVLSPKQKKAKKQMTAKTDKIRFRCDVALQESRENLMRKTSDWS